jgi:hypothetical protein
MRSGRNRTAKNETEKGNLPALRIYLALKQAERRTGLPGLSQADNACSKGWREMSTIQKKDYEAAKVEHDTGTNVQIGKNISVHLGKDGLIDIHAGGKTIYTGRDPKAAGETVNQARAINRLYGDD